MFPQKGELVCVIPSMPIFSGMMKVKKNIKDLIFQHDNIWHHSDFIEISDTGAVKVMVEVMPH